MPDEIDLNKEEEEALERSWAEREKGEIQGEAVTKVPTEEAPPSKVKELRRKYRRE